MASKFKSEFPFPVKQLTQRYRRLEKVPFRLELGGKSLEIIVADSEDLYLIYDLQQQVIYGVEGLNQPPMISRLLSVLIELWPTSVLDVKNPKVFKKAIVGGLMDWALEFGGLTREQEKAASVLRDLLQK